VQKNLYTTYTKNVVGMGNRKSKQALESLLQRFHEEYPDFLDDAEIQETSQQSLTAVARISLTGVLRLPLDSQVEAAALIGDIAQGVLSTYNLTPDTTPIHDANAKKDGYVSLFRTLVSAADILPVEQKTAYLTRISEQITLDAELNLDFPHQLVPRFATELLQPAIKAGVSQQVWQALEYLEGIASAYRFQPADELIHHEACFGKEPDALTSSTVREFAQSYESILGAAHALIAKYGISAVAMKRQGVESVKVTLGKNGRSQNVILEYRGGVDTTSYEILSMTTQLLSAEQVTHDTLCSLSRMDVDEAAETLVGRFAVRSVQVSGSKARKACLVTGTGDHPASITLEYSRRMSKRQYDVLTRTAQLTQELGLRV
jgi:hypothetical protein